MTDGKIESMGEPNRIDVFINYRSTFTNQQLISVGKMRTDRTMRMRVYARMSLCTCTWVNGVGKEMANMCQCWATLGCEWMFVRIKMLDLIA